VRLACVVRVSFTKLTAWYIGAAIKTCSKKSGDPGHMPLRYPHIKAVFVFEVAIDHLSRQA
jgi:hypothetical protein